MVTPPSDNWEPTLHDVRWAEEQALNWMYGEHYDPQDKDFDRIRQATIEIILFTMQRLNTHHRPHLLTRRSYGPE
jgi:hypothetical protein